MVSGGPSIALIMFFVILVPVLLLFAVGLVIWAIVKNRPGVVAAVGGTFLVLFVALPLAFLGVRSAAVSPIRQIHVGPVSMQTIDHVATQPTWSLPQQSPAHFKMSWVGLMFVIGLTIAVVLAMFRNAGSHRHSGPGGGWVAGILGLVALVFLGLIGINFVRARASAEQQANVARQDPLMHQMVAINGANDRVKQIAQMDIHALMDKSDAPQIPLSPEPPAPPKDGEAASANENTDAGASAAPTSKQEASKDGSHKKDEQPATTKKKLISIRDKATQAEADSPDTSVVPARPAWVDSPPKRVGEIMREVIATDEYASVDECTRANDVYLLLKTYERLMELAGTPVFESSLPSITFNDRDVVADGTVILSSDGGRTWNWNDPRIAELSQLGIGVDFVRREIVSKDGENYKQYFDTVDRSIGPMHKLYTEIEFTPSVDNELRQRWATYERGERLAKVGLGASGILGLLGMAYGLLKVDTWTKGYYSKRLFLGVPAAIIGLVTLLALLVGP